MAELFASDKPIELAFPAVVDFSSVRCPETDKTTHNEWRRTTARPAHWGAIDPATGKPTPALRGELEDHIDKLELAEVRKNGIGRRQESEYERCRDPGGPEKPTS